jgi:hypothetical protein
MLSRDLCPVCGMRRVLIDLRIEGGSVTPER